jgi:hypothetical protein
LRASSPAASAADRDPRGPRARSPPGALGEPATLPAVRDEQPGRAQAPRWWAFRGAQSLRAATYRCPLCDEQLHAMSEHVLLAPEGAAARRRHAHLECVLTARRAGRLPTRDEWRASR